MRNSIFDIFAFQRIFFRSSSRLRVLIFIFPRHNGAIKTREGIKDGSYVREQRVHVQKINVQL